MFNKDLQLYKSAIMFNSDLVVFPFVAAFLLFVVNITDKSFDINGVMNINAWIGSFASSFFIYMVFDLILSKTTLFKRHKYIFIGFSFVVSTFISECISFTIKQDLSLDSLRHYIPLFLADVVFLIIMVIYGIKRGIEKISLEIVSKKQECDALISKMTNHERKEIIEKCKKAISLDDFTFGLICSLKSKGNIKELINDLNNE